MAQLLAARTGAGHWRSELSSSALSTATAACALALHGRSQGQDNRYGDAVRSALGWLQRHQNADGGWGDTVDSPSNLSTTVLCWAALGLEAEALSGAALPAAEAWLRRQMGDLRPATVARHVSAAYGEDKTFSVPILTLCALTGRFGTGAGAWRDIPSIPFELAAVPQRFFRLLGLPMVSYAMPALIAMGQVGHFHHPTRQPLSRFLRWLTRRRTLQVLTTIQPASGGFLEAAPLTSFVIMSLVGCQQGGHPVVQRGLGFLMNTVRPDGSWPIDTNLNSWVTSLAVTALSQDGRLAERLSTDQCRSTLTWLLERQYRDVHPYTRAAAGGWAWTELSGGVPDADDTPAALLALSHLTGSRQGGEAELKSIRPQAAAGLRWLLGLQNRDGGIPTFCRGWGRMPFDRSSPDLTAHTLRAWACWCGDMEAGLQKRLDRASARALRYLCQAQRQDGAWVPLWFGNQKESQLANRVYGTARVLLAASVQPWAARERRHWQAAVARGMSWLLNCRNTDGGWGGAAGVPSSIEETGLAVEALALITDPASAAERAVAVADGVAWLQRATDDGRTFPASPIGLYFARLWYSERLYPIIFAVGALVASQRLSPLSQAPVPVGEA